MKVRAVLAQAAKEGGPRVAGWPLGSVYIARAVVHTFHRLRSMRGPQVEQVGGVIALRGSCCLHPRSGRWRMAIWHYLARVNDRRPRPSALERAPSIFRRPFHLRG